MAPLHTTLGQMLINQALPPDLRDYERTLDKEGVKQLFQDLADKHPDKYREVAKRLLDVGREAAYTTGGHSVGLSALKSSLAVRKMRQELGKELEGIYSDRSLSPAAREQAIIEAASKRQKDLVDDVFKESRDEDNPLARQIVSGARGNPIFLNSLRGADLLYVDHRDKVVPLPVLKNYSQGLTGAEYFAGAFGTRKGVVNLKLSTPDAGALGKQLVAAAHRLRVSALDSEEPYDSSQPRGMPVDTEDPHNLGSLLAHPAGGYPRNTEMTPRILKDLQARGVDRILLRSPTVGGPEDGGVYARDLGRRERGGLSPTGDFVGIAAGQAIAEPLAQAAISSKHTGGVVGATSKGVSGFKAVEQLAQVPSNFRGGAAHAQKDGIVQEIRAAPQGGFYATIDNEEHYIGHGAKPIVKKGDTVEAGDAISEGTPNPAEIVKHKGIGAGRRYFVDAFHKALQDAGQSGSRRNVELMARALINHVQLTDELGDYAPDDVVPYHTLEHNWEPRPGTVVTPPSHAVNRYLEKPVLHYTIGTRIRPSMLKELEKFGVKRVFAHSDPPPFEPVMIRALASPAHDPDWMVRMLGGYQKNSLLEGARRGAVSDEAGTSYVPALARGESFGRGPLDVPAGPTSSYQRPGDLR